ncbi:MAG: protease modulator HflK [Kiritimatiellaeota bacterium]|nr:protease modulator HflK [Kiritimatiellota bacterium]
MNPTPHLNGGAPRGDESATKDRGMQSLVRTLGVLFVALRILIILMLVLFVFGGMFSIKEDEQGMLFRFGKLIPKGDREVLPSGWYWGFPYPVDRVERIQAQRSVTVVTKQFWPQRNPALLNPQAPPPSSLIPGIDGYVVTGDANIMHMVWAVTYRVTDAKRYYLLFYQDPDRPELDNIRRRQVARGVKVLIENLLDQSVLHEVAGWPVEDVLVLSRGQLPGASTTMGRESLTMAVQRRLEQKVRELQLGIEVQQVSLIQGQPPSAVRKAFNEVVNAAQEYRTAVDTGKARAEQTVTLAAGRASTIIAEAYQYRDRIVKSAQADAKYFEKILNEYRKTPEVLLALYTEVLQNVLANVGDKFIVHSKTEGSQEIRVLIGPIPRKLTGPEPGGPQGGGQSPEPGPGQTH